jgi:uncharacterized protein YidB (DUF937 family)
MSLLDMAGQLFGGQGANTNAGALSAVLNMVNSHPGGLPGLISAFEQNGLGGAVQSWVSNGPNQPVNGQQIQNVIPSGALQEVAAKLGVSPDVAGTVVAQVLPRVVDHLTPNGQVPAAGTDLMSECENMLKAFVK